jgi:ArsR family transcriptional regulator
MNDNTPLDESCCGPIEPVPPVTGSPEDEFELAAMAKGLAHPMRVRILRILIERRACLCGELVAELPISQATVSQHLKALKEAGLVRGEIDGPRVCYCASPERLERLSQLLGIVHPNQATEEPEVIAA